MFLTTRGHEYPQPCAKLIRHPKNQREKQAEPLCDRRRERSVLWNVLGPGVSFMETQVWVSGYWLINMLRQRLLKRQVSLLATERALICFVLQVAVGLLSFLKWGRKSIQDASNIHMESQQNKMEVQLLNDSYSSKRVYYVSNTVQKQVTGDPEKGTITLIW